MTRSEDRPTWAPRLSRFSIAQLYRRDAAGLHDGELVDEVGIGLLLRVEDCLKATRAIAGEVECPDCGAIIRRVGVASRRNDELIRCAGCGWQLPWAEYHRAASKKHLGSAGLRAIFADFVARYPKGRTYSEKMLLIDGLLHRYHWELEGEPGGPAAVNLIGGTRMEVLAFLNQLTYTAGSTEGLSATKGAWLAKLNYSGYTRQNVDELSRRHPVEFEMHDEGDSEPAP